MPSMRRLGVSKDGAVLAALLTALLLVCTVSSAPANSQSSGHAKDNNDRTQLSSRENDKTDKDVLELESLKPAENRQWGGMGSSLTLMKSASSVEKNINGQREMQSERREEVGKNGKMVARLHQQLEEKAGRMAPTPLTHIRTEVEFPEQNFHKVFETGPRINTSEKRNSRQYTRPEADENNVEMLRSYSGVQFSPMDMAEYIFWAGDEKGVTMAIEDFLDEGLMSREEAIAYLQDIKLNLDYLQTHYNEQNLAREQTHELRKNLGLFEKAKLARNEASELAAVRQQMRENVIKKNAAEVIDSEPIFQSRQQHLQGLQALADNDDYDDLLERLRVADFLYTESSLEEVVYQLAKVMFSQSLTRGSNEAQEALEKFTRFLETETEMGRISRSLEKKVLDVLIAGLTDTLTEHPELVPVARESLGVGAGSPVDDQVLQQLLILNRGGGPSQAVSSSDKTDSVKTHPAGNVVNGDDHRFSGGRGLAGGRDAPVMMKKSGPPPQMNEKLSAEKST